MKKIAVLLCLALLPLWAAATIPPNYYDRADGKKKTDLKSALRQIIGKANVLDYGSGAGKTWTGFYTTDRYNGRQVRDRYSYREFYFSATATAQAASSVSGMNIEHSFPKSWWGGSENQAYKDLYNLLPCESNINSSKSNYAMGVVTSATTDNGCTKVGKGMAGTQNATLWEPADEWKGDFARNYFYMVTAYSNLTWTGEGLKMLENNDWPTLKSWAQELLLEWNRQDPVDQIETARNEAVYGIQGNRNPFIDYPNLAEYIWGDSVDYAFSVDGSDISKPAEDDEEETVILLASDFTQGYTGWTVRNVSMPGSVPRVWTQSADYGMKASAYYNGTSYATESWLESGVIDLTDVQSAWLSFQHTGKFFGNMQQEATLWIKAEGEADWVQLPINKYMTGTNWTFVTNVTELSAFAGKKVKLGFRYTSSASASGQWEIRSVEVSGVKTAGADVEHFAAYEANEIVSSTYATRFDANWAKYAEGVTFTLDVYTKGEEGMRASLDGFPVQTTENTYRVKGVTPNTTYYYQVYVYNEEGVLKAMSNEVKVDFPDVQAVLDVSATQLSFSSMENVPSQAVTLKASLRSTPSTKLVVTATEPFEIAADQTEDAQWGRELELDCASPVNFAVRMSAQRAGEYTGMLTLTTEGVEPRYVSLRGRADDAMAFFEDFEKGSKGSYAEKEAAFSAATWNLGNALVAKDASANDQYSVRIKGGGFAEMVTDKENGCGKLWFYAGLYNKDTDMKLNVKCSIDGGQTWTTLGEEVPMEAWKQYEYEINQPGTIRLRFEAVGPDTKRINVDDVQMDNYKEQDVTPVPTPLCEAEEGDGAWYDLTGRAVSHGSKPYGLMPGLYIRAGRKVAVM